jgi:uncharacterized protein
VKIVDANVLLYAVNVRAEHHDASREWLNSALSGDDTVAFSWSALLAFIKLSTKPEVFDPALTTEQAMDTVDVWLRADAAVLVEPSADHASIVRRLLEATGTGGNLVVDAHIAALALEQGCAVVTYDNDFRRFPGVRSHRPGED